MSLENKLNNQGSNYKPTVRTNAYNVPGGTYNIPKASNVNGSNNNNSGVLKNLKGDTVNKTLSPYDENSPYLEQFNQPFDLDNYYSSNPTSNSGTNFGSNVKNKIDSYLNNVKDGASNALSDIGSFFNQRP